MARAPRSANDETIYDQVCGVIVREQGVSDASLKAAHVLAWNVGPSALVGLEAGGDRVVYHCTDDEPFAAAIPFDATGVRGDDAELLARGEGVRAALAAVEYAWVHPGYRDSLAER